MSKPCVTEIIQQTVDILVESGTIPTYAVFDIKEEMLQKYVEIYGSFSNGGNKKFDPEFARKIAGLNLLRLKFSRGAKSRECKEGMVYLIANPAWPDHLKIGMTIDSKSRLASYQTYDPYKKFYIKHYEFVLDRRLAEKKVLDDFGIHLVDGEWIKYSDSSKIIRTIRQY